VEAAETPQGSFGSRGRREHSTFRAGATKQMESFDSAVDGSEIRRSTTGWMYKYCIKLFK